MVLEIFCVQGAHDDARFHILEHAAQFTNSTHNMQLCSMPGHVERFSPIARRTVFINRGIERECEGDVLHEHHLSTIPLRTGLLSISYVNILKCIIY